MKLIRFSHDWNKKLSADIFTTIRKVTSGKEAYYRANINCMFEIILNSEKVGETELINVEELSFVSIPDTILRLDTGMVDYKKIIQLFKKFGMKSLKDRFLILTFRKKDNYEKM